MTTGIYCITNKINGKKYFGQSIDVERRLYEHKCNRKHNSHLKSAIDKYGVDNFTFELYKECESNDMDELERLLIQVNDTMNPLKGYNKESGGNNNKSLSYETKRKISDTLKGSSGYWEGKSRSEETKHKISESKKGQTSYWKGKKLPEGMVSKIQESRLETCKKRCMRIVKDGKGNAGKQRYSIYSYKKRVKRSIDIFNLLDFFFNEFPDEPIEIDMEVLDNALLS